MVDRGREREIVSQSVNTQGGREAGEREGRGREREGGEREGEEREREGGEREGEEREREGGYIEGGRREGGRNGWIEAGGERL